METLRFDLSKRGGNFKLLNATNGGPLHKRYVPNAAKTNFEEYKAARIPYSRNHDSAASSFYGGPHAHDIDMIFPYFDADENDPASYDFENTDECILCTLDAGTKTFFRLGQTIEHQLKKHGTLPPKNFKKWAVICEHIIRHYTEGWANGYTLDMPYWEIWNEPDLDPLPATHRRTWGGTDEEFFDLYEITAKRLKSCFPHLKIGGPALAHRLDWAENFLSEMQKRGTPIDFFTWHYYTRLPERVAEKSKTIQALLEKYGYGDAENILNEWGYVRGWGEQIIYSQEMMRGIKGAAYVMAVMSLAERSPIDMLMYYTTMLSAFNGVFDYYTFKPLKTYYVLKWYGMLYDMKHEVVCEDTLPNLYTLCGVNEEDKLTCIVTHFNESDLGESKDVHIDFGKEGVFEVYLLDEDNDATLLGEYTDLTFTMKRNSCLLIVEK